MEANALIPAPRARRLLESFAPGARCSTPRRTAERDGPGEPLSTGVAYGVQAEELFLDMLRETPTDFIRWASRAIMGWRWEGQAECPIYRLHGKRDRIIRPPRTDEAALVRGAGHVICLSHPQETNEFLREICARHGARSADAAVSHHDQRAERPPGRSDRGGRSVE